MGSNVTFEGEIEPKESGTFRFLLYYAGYTKVYVNDELVVPEIWRTAWNPNSHKFAVDLEQGKRVPIRIEWQPDGGAGYLIGFEDGRAVRWETVPAGYEPCPLPEDIEE